MQYLNLDVMSIVSSYLTYEELMDLTSLIPKIMCGVFKNFMFWKRRLEILLKENLTGKQINWKSVYYIIFRSIYTHYEEIEYKSITFPYKNQKRCELKCKEPKGNITAITLDYHSKIYDGKNPIFNMIEYLSGAYYNKKNKIEYFQDHINNYTNAIDILINIGYDPSIEYEHIIENLAEWGYDNIIKFILNDPRITYIPDNALKKAAYNSHYEVVKLIYYHSKFKYSDSDHPIFSIINCGHCNIIKLLATDPQIKSCILEEVFTIILKQNHDYSLIEYLLNNLQINPVAYSNQAIINASISGKHKSVKLLLRDPRVDPSAQNNQAIIEASKNSVEIVRLLLTDSRVDPSAQNNQAIIEASKNSVEIVQLLLNDPRVDPSAQNNQAIIEASKNSVDIVQLLLTDPRVDPSAQDSEAIIEASKKSVDMVKILLADPRVDPSAQYNQAIIEACKKCPDIVQLLLSDSRVNPAAQNNQAIIEASRIPSTLIDKPWNNLQKELLNMSQCSRAIIDAKKSYDIIKLLLARPLVNPVANNYSAINEICKKFNIFDSILTKLCLDASGQIYKKIIEVFKIYEDTAKLLLNDYRVDSISINNIFINACTNKYNSIVKLLLNDKKITQDYQYDNEIINAILNHNLELVKLLINNPNYIDQDNKLIFYTLNNIKGDLGNFKSDQCYISAISTLINHPNFNPSKNGDVIFIKLSEKGLYTPLVIILRNSNINPAAQDNQAILNASKNGHFHVVKLLLSDARVDPNDQNNKAVTLAKQNGHNKIVDMLTSDNRIKLNINQ
jgi:hypothetical protein